MVEVLESFGAVISAGVMVLLLFCGVYLSVRSGFFQLRGTPFIWKNTLGTLLRKEKRSTTGISPFQAMTTALARTMGVGNIAGVATAIIAGGPGAIFWMWVSALFGMITKYSEIYLAVKFRDKTPDGYSGGPMYYIQKGLGKRWLACIFAVMCALCSLGIGNMTQVNSLASALEDTFSIPAWISALAVMAVLAVVIFGGVKRIASVTEMVIPFISIVYIACSVAFLWLHRSALPGAFNLIVTSALGLRPALGGALGYGFSRALRFGLSRGVFTNEAGLGSAPIVHAAADCKSPAHQGVWGIFEVFLDTIVVCTITGLVLLCAQGGTLWQSGLDGALLTSAAFESAFTGFGGPFVSLSIVFFAVSAMLGWCYYGERSLAFLTGDNKTAITLYRLLFILAVLPGAMGEISAVWAVSDLLNALMAIPNLMALLALRREIKIP